MVGVGFCYGSAFAKHHDVLFTALMLRLIGSPPDAVYTRLPNGHFVEYDPELALSYRPDFSALLSKYTTQVLPLEFQVWVSSFPAASRPRLYAAEQVLREHLPDLEGERREFFIKREITILLGKTGLKPRMISNDTQASKVLYGTYFRNAGACVGARSNELVDIGLETGDLPPVLFAFCMSPIQLSRMATLLSDPSVLGDCVVVCGDDLFARVVVDGHLFFLGLDGDSHDSRINRSTRDIQMAATRACFPDIDQHIDYEHYVNAAFGVKFSSRFGITCRLYGQVQSGAPDTTFGNSLISAGLAHVLIDRIREHLGGLPATSEHLESAFALARADVTAAYGYVYTGKLTPDICEVDFLSGLFYPLDEIATDHVLFGCTYAFVPLPGKVLARLSWTARVQLSDAEVLSHHRDKVVNLYASYRHIPGLGAVLHHELLRTNHISARAGPDRLKTYDQAIPAPGPRGWDWLWNRYHLTEADHDDILNLSWPAGTGFVNHVAIQTLIIVDVLEGKTVVDDL